MKNRGSARKVSGTMSQVAHHQWVIRVYGMKIIKETARWGNAQALSGGKATSGSEIWVVGQFLGRGNATPGKTASRAGGSVPVGLDGKTKVL